MEGRAGEVGRRARVEDRGARPGRGVHGAHRVGDVLMVIALAFTVAVGCWGLGMAYQLGFEKAEAQYSQAAR